MLFITTPSASLRTCMGQWLFVGVVLLSFFGQLSLNSFSHTGENPRAELYRLFSIDIAPSASSPMDMSSCITPTHPRHASSHHHHDDNCPLCPLLGHILFALSTTFTWLGVFCRTHHHWNNSHSSHPSPRLFRAHPPSRAPPIII